MRESSMVWLALVLFAFIKLVIPWGLGSVDLADQSGWWPLAEQLVVTIAIAVLVWRVFENDGMVLIVVMLWLLAVPAWDAVTHFMDVANRPAASASPRRAPGA